MILNVWGRIAGEKKERRIKHSEKFNIIETEPRAQLVLKRKWFDNDCTIGELYIDGKLECFTLEDTCRKEKIKDITAIPPGKYELIINFSNRFQKRMPLLLNVPNFSGIRIHKGNTDSDTSGCILVGNTKGVSFIGESALAFDYLFPRLEEMLKTEKVFIDISGGRNGD